MPPELAGQGVRLMHQQCWCWGADIRRPEGNLLLQYGFSRQRPPVRDSGSTHYWKDLPGARIHLWGFGVVWEQPDGACYVNRYRFQPVSVPLELLREHVWTPDQFVAGSDSKGCSPLLAAQLAVICDFAAAYEQWVARELGVSYRAAVLAEFEHATVTADQCAASWQAMAEHLRWWAEGLK